MCHRIRAGDKRYRSNAAGRKRTGRRANGSVMPLVVVSLIAACVAVGIAADFMRDFQTVSELQYAADTAALYGSSLAANFDGSYNQASGQANMANAVISAGVANWNNAQCGPVNLKTWSLPVQFDQSDINFTFNPNPQDSGELLLQVRGRRDGAESLKQTFLKAVYAAAILNGKGMPANAGTAVVYRYTEIAGQPASRVGPAAPWSSPSGTPGQLLAGAAALPLAISNQQFQNFASANINTPQSLVVDLVSSTSAEYTGAAPPGHVKGALVNVGPGSNGAFFGVATGNSALNQLHGLLTYFQGIDQPTINLPQMVERGSQLNAFNPADPTFATRSAEISSLVSALPLRFYIVPVLANDPSFAAPNTVAGFARLQLTQVTIKKGTLTNLTFNVGEPIPMRNTSSANGIMQTSPSPQLMPAPIFPFIPRQYDAASGGISRRAQGVALAPALSPRTISAFN